MRLHLALRDTWDSVAICLFARAFVERRTQRAKSFSTSEFESLRGTVSRPQGQSRSGADRHRRRQFGVRSRLSAPTSSPQRRSYREVADRIIDREKGDQALVGAIRFDREVKALDAQTQTSSRSASAGRLWGWPTWISQSRSQLLDQPVTMTLGSISGAGHMTVTLSR
jgi:hypothetical protein